VPVTDQIVQRGFDAGPQIVSRRTGIVRREPARHHDEVEALVNENRRHGWVSKVVRVG